MLRSYSQPSTIITDNLSLSLFYAHVHAFSIHIMQHIYTHSQQTRILYRHTELAHLEISVSSRTLSLPHFHAFLSSYAYSSNHSLFLFPLVILSLSLGKIIPILRYTLEKYAMPKIGWRPEGNHSINITDNQSVYVKLCSVFRV